MAARGLRNLQSRIRPLVYAVLELQQQKCGLSSITVTSNNIVTDKFLRRRVDSGFDLEGRRGIFSWAGRSAGEASGVRVTEFCRRESTSASSGFATAEAHKDPQKGHEKAESEAQQEEEEELDEKTRTLSAALAHVPRLGWTEAAISAGARDVGLSPAIVGAFPRKEAAIVEFFMDECAHALAEELESQEQDFSKEVLQERIARIVWMRLGMQIPYLSKWAQALSIQANPLNTSTTLKQRAQLIDDILHFAGDRAIEVDWYAKRLVLGGVYSTTELYMLTDTSPGFRDTKAFLDRRIKDALDCRKTVHEAKQISQTFRAGLENTIRSFLNRKPPTGFGF